MAKLTLEPMAIGSLPHKDTAEAVQFVFDVFKKTPFLPQLAGVSRKEDMIVQYCEGLPGLKLNDENLKVTLDRTTDDFFEQLEAFYTDYDEIINSNNDERLEKYAISNSFASALPDFCKNLETTAPTFAKIQVTGPFTWGTSISDEEGRCAFYDETLRDVLIKTIALKALWQIKIIKKVSPSTTPIVFLDEPAISQAGTSTFVTIKREEIIEAIKEISDVIKANGGLSGVHCCGKADWSILLDAKVNIMNLDGYFYAKNLSLYHKSIEKFLEQGGYIAWGIVPTLDVEVLETASVSTMVDKFEEAVSFLTEKGISKKLILNQSFITPSCGAGALSLELAKKAINLTIELSEQLKQRYSEELAL